MSLLNNIRNYRWIKRAKKHYESNKYTLAGMCNSFAVTTSHRIIYYEISKYIPEFYPEFFGSNADSDDFWWDMYDFESRIKAFDTLLEIYKKKIGFISRFI